MTSFFRVLKFAFQDLVRNISLSVMTVLILVLMLLSVNTIIILNVFTDEATNLVKDKINVSVYFEKSTSEKKIKEVQQYIKKFPEVEGMKYKSPQTNLKEFKTQHEKNSKIIESIKELKQNPLGATLIVDTKQPQDYKKIIKALDVPEYKNVIEAKTFADTKKAINRIESITNQVEKISLVLSAIFAVIAFIIIFNTIRVAIYTQRTEISIKKLVGATNWFVRGPYLMEGLIFSILSVVISGGAVYFGVQVIDPYIAEIFQTGRLLTNYFSSNIMLVFGTQFGAVLLLTWVSSMFAMRKYLKV
jgi:cell division transport system permease protein